jgi:hypothetical protein
MNPSQDELQQLLGVLAGIGLAAACGFRVFVPMLVVAIGIRADLLHVAEGFQWLGSTPALVSLSVATIVEIVAYYVPGLDHLLDGLASPAAVVAGTVVAASFVTDVDPWFRWTLAAIAGGGAAAVVQTATVAARSASGVLTFGLGNPIVATAELFGASITTFLAFVAPILIVLALVATVVLLVRWHRRRTRARAALPQLQAA